MIEYPQYADMVGSTIKTFWAGFLPQEEHRNAFNKLVDAKVALNKSMYNATKEFVKTVNDATQVAK